MVRLAFFTAWTSPSAKVKWTLRSAISSSVAIGSAVPGIERVTQAVADEVEAEKGHRHEQSGEQEHPGRRFHLVGAVGDQDTPTGERLLNAQAQEGKKAFGQDHARHRQRDV